DVEEALQYLRKEGRHNEAKRPDIILLDLNMPRKSGYEILKEIKSDQTIKDIPVIIFTSSESNIDVAKSYQNGADSFLTKPVGIEGYSQVISVLKTIHADTPA